MKKIISFFAVLGLMAGSFMVLESLDNNNLNSVALAQEVNATTCAAQATCYYGGTAQGSISCSGTNGCVSGYMSVACDGKVFRCTQNMLPTGDN